jgi:hypothetical protein
MWNNKVWIEDYSTWDLNIGSSELEYPTIGLNIRPIFHYLSLDDGKLRLGVILSFFLNSRQRELLLRVIRTYFLASDNDQLLLSVISIYEALFPSLYAKFIWR